MCTPTPVWCNQHLKSNQFLSSEFPDQLHWFKEKMGDYAGRENYPLNCYFSFTHPYFLVIQWEGCFQTRNAFFSFIVFITFSSSPGQGVWPRWSLLQTVPADLRPHRVPQPRHPLSRLPHPSGDHADDENVHGHHDHDQRPAHPFFFLDQGEHLGVRGSLSFRELFTAGSFERCGRGGGKSEREDQTLLQVSSSLSNVHKQKANKHSLQPLRLAREIRSNSCWGAGEGKHMPCMVSSADIHSFYLRVTFNQWCVLE